MRDLPAHPSPRGADAERGGDLCAFFVEICQDCVRVLARRERADNGPMQLRDDYLAPAGFHRSIIRMSTAVENLNARVPAGVRW